MNKVLNKLRSKTKKSKKLNLLISIVILVEIIAIVTVASFAWVETVSSVKITNETGTYGTVDTYVFTEATIGTASGTIDLGDYFRQAGDMHLAPASSADGTTFYFPKANLSSGFIYRKGNVSDKNTAYLSVSFKLKADTNADFFFEQVPSFGDLDNYVRVSVTSSSEGSTAAPVTKIYAKSASTTAVVNSTTGATGATEVGAFEDHDKGSGSSNRLFAVGANETKIVTINLWLQKRTDSNADLTNVMSSAVTISNFGITSSLTPRHVTLLATPTWDLGATDQTFYAWCWNAKNGDADRLYKLALDANEHYAFDYNGTYQNTLFFRCGNKNLETADMSGSWSSLGLWNKTADTRIPDTPVDPTYIIQTINGGAYDGDINGNKSTGTWLPEPATIQLAYVSDNGVSAAGGSLSATTYRSTSVDANEVIETTNPSSAAHITTVHAWPGKKIKLVATCNTDYRFDGWYTDEAGTTSVSTNATYVTDAPSTASEVTYYAKFKEVRTVKMYKYVDGTNSSIEAGTMTIGSSTSTANVKSWSATFDKGSSVTFSATANTGYTLVGIKSTASATGSDVSSPINPLDNNTNLFAWYTINSYQVTARPCYTDTTGGTSFNIANTGGTVKVGDASATSGSTTSSYEDVKYTKTVSLKAQAASGYEFVGWYTEQSSGSEISKNAEYTYTLSNPDAVTVYGRFMKKQNTVIYVAPRENWGDNYYVRLYQGDGVNVIDSNNGFVQAQFDHATGFYKATFSTSKTGSFYALIAKDTDHTGKVPSSGGYTGNLGSSYIFKHDQSASALTAYSAQRCIWFIIGDSVSWIKDNIRDYGDYMNIWDGSDHRMRRINDSAYVWDYTTAPTGTFYFQQHYSGTNYRNQWTVTLPSGKSQFKATSFNSGSWLPT